MKHKTITCLLFIFIILDIVFFIAVPFSQYQISCWWYSKYDIESFNCEDMSIMLEEKFEYLGFDTKIVYGDHREIGLNDSAHCWLLVNGWEFESTTLEFKKVSDGYRIYRIDEGNYPIRGE